MFGAEKPCLESGVILTLGRSSFGAEETILEVYAESHLGKQQGSGKTNHWNRWHLLYPDCVYVLINFFDVARCLDRWLPGPRSFLDLSDVLCLWSTVARAKVGPFLLLACALRNLRLMVGGRSATMTLRFHPSMECIGCGGMWCLRTWRRVHRMMRSGKAVFTKW